MIKLLAVSLIATLLSLGSLNIDTNRATRTIKEEQPISRTVNVFSEPFDEEHVVFHYHRSDGNYTSWDLWVWGQNEEGFDFDYTGEDDYGKYGFLPLSTFNDTSQVNFIIRPGGWTQQTGDINVQFADFTLQADNAYHLYLVNLEENVYHSPEAVTAGRVLDAKFISASEIYLATNIDSATYTLKLNGNGFANGPTNDVYNEDTYRFESDISIPNTHDIDLQGQDAITVSFTDSSNEEVTTEISLAGLFDDPLFVEELTYDGNDLGATYTSSRTSFKAWAPTTTSLKLRLYDNGTPTLIDNSIGDDTYSEYAYIKGDKGVWTVSVDGDLHGKYYTLVATNGAGTNEFVDPYARAAGVNGLRGMIVDFSKTNPEGWDEVDFSVKKPTEIIPYELHVADLTADDTWNGQEANRKRFLGLIEEGTTYTGGDVTVSTGFDHIKELGINALQILPFYDQENSEVDISFNWGYNPRNYNVLEGSYASNPYDGLVRINEFKQVVKRYAQEDIRIIMDVVYNHVANISGHSFSKLVPGYYFRHTPNGGPSNASGVGNDTASERIMMARYMVDSTFFLASEYKLGGFRFDLMGLHTTEAMNMLSEKLHEDYRDDIIIFGEAWDMDSTAMSVRSPLANYANVDDLDRVGAFNDQIRDAVKGSVFKGTDAGFVQTSVNGVDVAMRNRIKFGLLGKVYGGTNDPSKTVNYVSVHDNNTLWDKIQMAGEENFGSDQARLRKQALQAQSFVLTAQGISFVHAGSEMLRSKPLEEGGFDHNSYKSPYSVNSLKWDEKIDNLDIFSAYQDMIELKRDEAAFQYSTRSEVDDHVSVEFGSDLGFDDTVFKMTVEGDGKTYVVVFVGATSRVRMDLSGHSVIFDTSGNATKGQTLTDNYSIYGNTTLILELGNGGGTTSEPSSEPGEASGLGTGAIVAISFGSVGVAGGIGALIYFVIKRKKIQIIVSVLWEHSSVVKQIEHMLTVSAYRYILLSSRKPILGAYKQKEEL